MNNKKIRWRYVYLNHEKTNYKVSSDGRIKNTITKHFISLNTIDKYGYVQVCLSHKNKKYVKTLHTIVATAFIPNPENKPQVNHKNGNKLKNDVDNLEWVTAKENIIHAYNNGLHDNVAKGETHGLNVYSENVIHKVCELLQDGKMSVQEISYTTGVAKSTIHDILSGKYWKHISDKYDIYSYRERRRFRYVDEETRKEIKRLAKLQFTSKEIRKSLSLPYSDKLYSVISYYVGKYKI